MSKVSAKIGLPFGVGEVSGDWVPDSSERDAAWEMYIELVTRVGVVELSTGEGLMREALSSLHSLFETTRHILRKYGPSVARPKEGATVSFGQIAVAILNGALRPLLSKWHPLLNDREASRPEGISIMEWESSWELGEVLRGELNEVGGTLSAYAGLLGEVCDAKSLLRLTERLER